jgi:hypothetical protein
MAHLLNYLGPTVIGAALILATGIICAVYLVVRLSR